MRAHRDPRLDLKLDAVLRNGGDRLLAAGRVGAVDDLGVHGGHHGFEHALAGLMGGEVDGCRLVEAKIQVGFFRSDEGTDDLVDIATSQIMRFELVGREGYTGFHRGDAALDDQSDGHAPQPHAQ